jgi:HPt (histidine-containing phosphotransfer) domain-containing protein
MTAGESIDRLFMTLIERQESTFDAIRSANERYYRFARSVLEASRQGARDWTNVARGWAQRPTDIVGLYESISEAAANSQARRLALWQEALEDLAESQREGQEMMRGGLGRVREAVESVQENIPSFLRERVSALRRNEKEPAAKS